MSDITILSKQPPGGRCSLYLRYADALRKKPGLEVKVRYCDDGAEVPPSAMLIGDALITPSDGVILSLEDIAVNLRDRLPEPEVVELGRLLEATQEQWMEEWSND